MLLYAAERLDSGDLRNTALQLLTKCARRKLHGLPGPIVPLLPGKIDATDAEQLASAHTPLPPRRMCQADFYIGVRALRDGNREEFVAHMRRATAWNPIPRERKHYFALWEVSQSFPEHIMQ